MTNPIIDELPAVARIDAEIASQRQAESQVMERAAEVGRSHRAAYALWESKAVEAELSGKKVPAVPGPPDLTVSTLALERVRATIERLIRERLHAIVEADEVVHEQALAEITAVTDEARPHREALQALLPRASAAAAAVDAVADARQATDTKQTTYKRRVPGIDVAAVLAAVETGPSALLAGRDPRADRQLGFQPGGTLGESTATPAVRQTVTDSSSTGQSVTVVATNKGAAP